MSKEASKWLNLSGKSKWLNFSGVILFASGCIMYVVVSGFSSSVEN